MEILYALIALAFVSLSAAWIRSRKKGLSVVNKKKILSLWRNVCSMNNPNARVLEAEKVVDLLFTDLGYSGSFGEKLKTIGKGLPNEQNLWSAHKLRNRIAHEAGIIVSTKEAKAATKAFSKVITKYTK